VQTRIIKGASNMSPAEHCEFTTDWAIAPSSCSHHDRRAASRSQATGYPFPTLSHDQLLSLACTTAKAAREHDPDQVQADALRLFEALSDHILAERRTFLRHLSAGDARLIRHAHQKLEDLVLRLAASAAQKTDRCDCESLADAVVAQLSLQAADERRQLLAVAD
jgi:hypothetical protein